MKGMKEMRDRWIRGMVRDSEGKAKVVDLRCKGRTDFVLQAKRAGFRCSMDHVWPIEFVDGFSTDTRIETWMFDGSTKKTLKRYGLGEGYAVQTGF